MNRFSIMTLAALLIESTSAFASDATTAPDAGTYSGGIYVSSTSGTDCLDRSGDAYFTEVSFSGLSGSKHYIHMPLVGSPGAVVSAVTITVKSGKGTTNLGGTLAWTGNGVGGNWDVTGTFSATITEVGAHAFVMQAKLSYTNCTEEDWNVSLVRMGTYQ